MARKGGLGRGLDALIPGSSLPPVPSEGGVYVPAVKIIPNPRQPRYKLRDEDLQELANSIREHGILQPLIVTQDLENDRYILIAGERRLRAARLINLQEVPVIIRQVTDQQRLELALIENIQRADLTPLETAEAFLQLNEEFGLSHEEIAHQVGKSRVTVTNNIRLLKLPDTVREKLADGLISEGHARAILGLNNPQGQIAAVQTIIKQDLTVRQTEVLVRKLLGDKPAPKAAPQAAPEIRELEDRLQKNLGTKVSLHHGKLGGSIVIRYYSDEELNSLVNQLLKESL